jgi:hypothetical protein
VTDCDKGRHPRRVALGLVLGSEQSVSTSRAPAINDSLVQVAVSPRIPAVDTPARSHHRSPSQPSSVTQGTNCQLRMSASRASSFDYEAGNGLLARDRSPHKSPRRQLNISSFTPRRVLLFAIALVACVFAVTWFGPSIINSTQETRIPEAVPGERIPLGQSRERDGREVFWWEQFPRYVKSCCRAL